MQRTPEPELMTNQEQAEAYAAADFAEVNGPVAGWFLAHFPPLAPGARLLDIGCGTADLTIRLVRAYPGITARGIDGSEAMLAHGRELVATAGLSERIVLECRYFPDGLLAGGERAEISGERGTACGAPARAVDAAAAWSVRETPGESPGLCAGGDAKPRVDTSVDSAGLGACATRLGASSWSVSTPQAEAGSGNATTLSAPLRSRLGNARLGNASKSHARDTEPRPPGSGSDTPTASGESLRHGEGHELPANPQHYTDPTDLHDQGLEHRVFDAVTANNLLHHLSDPPEFWRALRKFAKPGAPVLVADLRRPADAETVERLVEQYAWRAKPALKRDFRNSLHAAYTVEEVREQLDAAGQKDLTVQEIGPLHLIVWGYGA
jgi:ubiquinone/menaquinone biosynthesis C-methylase UbiE